MKWQRKLGAPKPDESFHDLLARARMLEEHEKQFSASAESCTGKSGRKSGSVDPKRSSSQKKTEQDSSSSRRLVIYVETALRRRVKPLEGQGLLLILGVLPMLEPLLLI